LFEDKATLFIPLTTFGAGKNDWASCLFILFEGLLLSKLSFLFEVKDESDLKKKKKKLFENYI
jgi:hypothetical protein